MSRKGGGDRAKRLGGLIREIVADELRSLTDERLSWLSVTEVRTDRELETARVYVTALDPETLDDAVAALAEHRVDLQSAIARQTRLRRVPRLEFVRDDVIESAARVEEILRDIADERPSDGGSGT